MAVEFYLRRFRQQPTVKAAIPKNRHRSERIFSLKFFLKMKKSTFLFLLSMAMTEMHGQTLIFSKNIGGPRYDDARAILVRADGSLVFTGLTKSGDDSLGSVFLTKTNAAGAILWSRRFDRPQEDGGNGLLETRDGGFLITGHTALTYGEECDGMIIKTDGEGREMWRAFVGTALDDVTTTSLEMDDGSFISIGRIEDAATRSFRILLARLDANGNQVFLKKIGRAPLALF